MIWHLLIWHALVIVIGHVNTWVPGLVLIAVIGALHSFAMISMAVLLLSTAEESFRGRVSGVRMLAVYGLPLGLVLGGALIELMGVPLTFTAYGVAGIVIILGIVLRWPNLLRR